MSSKKSLPDAVSDVTMKTGMALPIFTSSDPLVGYFSVSFIEKMYSRYSSKVIFRSLDQQYILTFRTDDREVEESLMENPFLVK